MSDKQYVQTLTIGGLHGAGSVGLLVDLKTFSALGCRGSGVATLVIGSGGDNALTSHYLPTEVVRSQLRTVLSHHQISAVKIGLLSNLATLQAITEELRRAKPVKLVLDLVLLQKDGQPWLDNQALDYLLNELVPMSQIITPNLQEAEYLMGVPLRTEADVATAARSLSFLRPKAVLIKDLPTGQNQVADCLFLTGTSRPTWLRKTLLDAPQLVGAGCTLSSAIAAFLAHGHTLASAVNMARDYVQTAIFHGRQYSSQQTDGFSTLHHAYQWWE